MINIPQLKPLNEEQEVIEAKIEVAKKYYITPKYQMWEEYFLDKKNKDTFGNATQSACKAYGLDPHDPKAYNVASVVGHKNLRKVKDLRRKYWEAQGLTPGKLLEVYNNMMLERKDVNMLYSIGDDIGAPLPEYKQVVTPKIGTGNNTQINANDVQITFTGIEAPKE